MRLFNNYDKNLKTLNCTNYLVLTQLLIYFFMIEIIPKLIQINNN